MRNERKKCFNLGRAWLLALPPEGRTALELALMEDDFMDYVLDRVPPMPWPIDFLFGVSMGIEQIDAEDFYE